eukprot:8375893-Pyramimonas_sp.AAC.1
MFPPIGPVVYESHHVAKPKAPDHAPLPELPEPPAEAIIRSPEFFGTHRVGQGDLLRVGSDPVLYLSLEGDTMRGAALCVRAQCGEPSTASTVVWLKDDLETSDLAGLYSSTPPKVKPEPPKVRRVVLKRGLSSQITQS